MDVTFEILYEDYIIATDNNKYTFEVWKKVIVSILTLICKEFIYKNGVFIFPRRMGFISLVKCKSRNTCHGLLTNGDKMKSVQKKILIMKLNYETFGYMFYTKWDTRLQYTQMRNSDYYQFRWHKNIKGLISKFILESHSDRSVPSYDTVLHRV